MIIGIIGSGAMGAGIGQIAAMAGNEVRIFDKSKDAKIKAFHNIQDSINKFVSKGTLTPSEGVAALGRIHICEKLETMSDCDLVIEAIIEDLVIKKELLQSLEKVVSQNCILASNTSSLSITSIAACLLKPERCLGAHFFNPPVLMKLVEIIPALQTNFEVIQKMSGIIESWGKQIVLVKDTPGFIVNKVARPFYSEALRILEEGIADMATIDFAMTKNGFKMGPFTLMDFIGHDVNYRVTESVWKSFYYESKYRPSLTQLRLLEAGYLGRKSGRGFYQYNEEINQIPSDNKELLDSIFIRIFSMLVNEATDTIYQNICTLEDVEVAMKLGVAYPKGLIEWGREIGINKIINTLNDFYDYYHEERYRVCPYLKNLGKI
ncbi:MAG: 3-hydroxybutyryl-CoA dehydrogenase [Saprospiraceae bacterium]|nr:3-hydroxybutyryl-CoA dehydrogenase [Saprospiraceae bacterium]